MGRRRKWGFSWSWRRASGYSAAKGRLSRRLGVPLTRAGRQRKVGASLGCSVLILAVSLFAAATGACRPDGGPKVWDWPKEKAATDGPICLEVGHLTGEADAPAGVGLGADGVDGGVGWYSARRSKPNTTPSSTDPTIIPETNFATAFTHVGSP